MPDEDLLWIDGSQLPLEGKGFSAGGEDLYARLPAELRTEPDLSRLKGMARTSTGLNFRFKTDLVAELKDGDRDFWKNLHIVRMKDMIVADGDGAFDYAHVNDIGARQIAVAFAAVLRRALDLD